MSDIKIFTVIPHMEDATSFYRGQMPIAELNRTYPISLIYVQKATWATLSICDIVFMQRPFTPEHLQVVELADKMKKPLWLDFDDDLFSVPEDNMTHALYGDAGIRKNIATMVSMAAQVTVSTEALAERFDEIRRRAKKPNCIVVPNALPRFLVEQREAPPTSRRKAIFWRGSSTHMKDLMTVSKPIVEFMEAHRDWSIHFMGYNPFWITSKIPSRQCAVAPAIDILDYFQYVRQITPGVMVVPLFDSAFNRAKSNIAWLEGSLGHAHCVAPDFKEWQMPGVINYGSPAAFRESLELAAQLVEEGTHSDTDRSWAHILDTLVLEDVNEKRWEVVQSMAPRLGKTKGDPANEIQSYRRHYGGAAAG